jgi:N-acetylneuraminic acid mutarotase
MTSLRFVLVVGVLISYGVLNGFIMPKPPIAFSQLATPTPLPPSAAKSTESSALMSQQQQSTAANTWTVGAPSPIPKMESAYASLDGKIYIIAGYGETGMRNKNSVEVYNTNNNTWNTSTAPVPTNLNHAAASTYNGKIYVVGGYLNGKIPSDKLFIYDPSQNSWEEGKSMPIARAALAAQFIGGMLYAVGGTSTGPLNVNEAYDPATDSWTEKAPMPTARQHIASAVVDGKLYVIGGRTAGKGSNLANSEAYDPKTNTWSKLAPMPTSRGGIAAAVVNGNIYVFGGEAPTQTFNNNEKYDPITNSWMEEGPMPTPRHGLAAVAIGTNIYVIGGGPQPDISFANVNQIYHVK